MASTKELIRQVIREELLKGDDPIDVATGVIARTPGQRVAFVKTRIENKKFVTVSGQLPDRLEDLIDAFAEAFGRVIANLQVVNASAPIIVTIPVTSAPGTPSAGTVVPIPTTPATPNVVMPTILP